MSKTNENLKKLNDAEKALSSYFKKNNDKISNKGLSSEVEVILEIVRPLKEDANDDQKKKVLTDVLIQTKALLKFSLDSKVNKEGSKTNKDFTLTCENYATTVKEVKRNFSPKLGLAVRMMDFMGKLLMTVGLGTIVASTVTSVLTVPAGFGLLSLVPLVAGIGFFSAGSAAYLASAKAREKHKPTKLVDTMEDLQEGIRASMGVPAA